MFDKFGEFNSYEELNLAAEGFKKEGDMDSLMELAEENGINREDVEDYLDGILTELTTPTAAALGRLDILSWEEIANNKNTIEAIFLLDIFEAAQALCICESSEEFAKSVMKKGKRLTKIFKLIKKEAMKHRTGDCAGARIPPRQLEKVVKVYFTESDKKCEAVIKEAHQYSANKIEEIKANKQRRLERR